MHILFNCLWLDPNYNDSFLYLVLSKVVNSASGELCDPGFEFFNGSELCARGMACFRLRRNERGLRKMSLRGFSVGLC